MDFEIARRGLTGADCSCKKTDIWYTGDCEMCGTHHTCSKKPAIISYRGTCDVCEYIYEHGNISVFLPAVYRMTNDSRRPILDEILYSSKEPLRWDPRRDTMDSLISWRLQAIALWNLPLSQFPQMDLSNFAGNRIDLLPGQLQFMCRAGKHDELSALLERAGMLKYSTSFCLSDKYFERMLGIWAPDRLKN